MKFSQLINIGMGKTYGIILNTLMDWILNLFPQKFTAQPQITKNQLILVCAFLLS